MALLSTGIETHPLGTTNPNSIINANWDRINTLLAYYNTRSYQVNVYGAIADQTYVLVKGCPVIKTIKEIRISTTSGTATGQLRVNGSNFGSSISLTSTTVSRTGTANLPVNAVVDVVITSGSTPIDLLVHIVYEESLP